MKHIGTVIILLLTMVCSFTASAELDWHGFVETYHAYQIVDEKEWLSSRTRLRLEPAYYDESWSVKSVFDLEKNEKQQGVDLLMIRELYMEYLGENWDVRLGRQILIWGKTEGLQILDAVSPWDYSEFLARDFDDLRIGVDALKLRYLQDEWTLEAIYLPRFQAAVQPDSTSPWFMGSANNDNTPKPAKSLQNGECGLRFLKYHSWGDISLVYLRSWSDDAYPVVNVGSGRSNPAQPLAHDFQRLNIFGVAASIPIETFMIRGELALYDGYDFLGIDSDSNREWQMFKNRQQLKWVLGLDWTPGSGWSFSAQVTDSQILDYVSAIQMPEHQRLATFSISKTLFRETVNCSLFSFVGLSDRDTFSRFSVDYHFTDNFHILTGFDLFTGSRGMFGRFDSNDEWWIKLKYSF